MFFSVCREFVLGNGNCCVCLISLLGFFWLALEAALVYIIETRSGDSSTFPEFRRLKHFQIGARIPSEAFSLLPSVHKPSTYIQVKIPIKIQDLTRWFPHISFL